MTRMIEQSSTDQLEGERRGCGVVCAAFSHISQPSGWTGAIEVIEQASVRRADDICGILRQSGGCGGDDTRTT